MGRQEENTKFKLIHPKLESSGWTQNDWQIDMEYTITAGRIQWDGKSARRARPQYADYLLRYKPSMAIAVVEAKSNRNHHLEGLEQVKNYAKKLGLWFAYTTNGVEIEFIDLKAGTQKTVSKFHTPEELWNMYIQHAGLKSTPASLSALTENYYDETNIGQRRRPRYYQEKAVRSAIEAILKKQNRVLIAQATGTGKTFCSMQLVYKLFKSRVAKKILFIVDRNLLADQAFNDFNSAMDKDACYRLSPKDETFPTSRDLYFGIYQTLVGQDDEGNETAKKDRYKEFPPDFFDLIVIDEAHRGGANQEGSWFRLLEYFKSAVQVGLTATPKNEESNNTYRYFGMPVVNYSLADGIEDGFLSPYIIKRVMSNIDALGYRPEHGDIKDIRGRILENRDYFTPDFERELSIPARTRAYAYKLLEHLFTTDPLGKTIVFCVDQSHALDMAKYAQEAFLRYKEKYNFSYNGQFAIRITGNDRDPNGKYPWLEKFADLESFEPIVVTTSKLLTTGIDVKTIKNIVIFRNVGSMVEFKQIIGRGTRIYDHEDKAREKLGFFILEYANFSTQLFDDPNWDGTPTDIIEEPEIIVDEGEVAGGESCDPSEQNEGADPDDPGLGIVDLPPEEEDRLRYRMSEEFLRGDIKMVAESISFVGPDGKPLTPEKFILYQSQVAKQNFESLAQLKGYWKDNKYRKDFLDQGAASMGINVSALNHLFFEKHKIREVDTLDVIAHLLFGADYLTKEERIAKAKQVDHQYFDGHSADAKSLVDDLLLVYRDIDFNPFLVTKELWQTPHLRKHGSIAEIQKKVGGQDKLMSLVNGLQGALYDEEIAA